MLIFRLQDFGHFTIWPTSSVSCCDSLHQIWTSRLFTVWYPSIFVFVCLLFNLTPQLFQTSSLEKSVLPIVQQKLELQQWISGEQLGASHLGTGNISKFHEWTAKYKWCNSPASGFFHYCLLFSLFPKPGVPLEGLQTNSLVVTLPRISPISFFPLLKSRSPLIIVIPMSTF